jgi:protein SEY1
VLRNPLYFVFLLILGAAAYVTYTLNLWGPMINMANAASSQALEEGKKRLRGFLEASEHSAAGAGVGRRERFAHARELEGEGYEMRRMNSGVKAKMDGAGSEGEDGAEAEDI